MWLVEAPRYHRLVSAFDEDRYMPDIALLLLRLLLLLLRLWLLLRRGLVVLWRYVYSRNVSLPLRLLLLLLRLLLAERLPVLRRG